MGGDIYFISDIHLGAPDFTQSHAREKKLVGFLQGIQPGCSELFLLGDVFDFWFEYKNVVPKGYVRLLGQLAAMADAGIKIWYFKGNHDMWVNDYFTREFGATVVANELEIMRQGKSLYLHHGDGLGPGDRTYKALKKVFRNRFAQLLFGLVPPALGIGVANRWSSHSRISNGEFDAFTGNDDEWLVQFARAVLAKKHVDYFVFGHRHLPLDIELAPGSRYINTGEWVRSYSYAVLRGGVLNLCFARS